MRNEFGPFDTGMEEQRDGFTNWADKRVLEWMQKAQSELGDRLEMLIEIDPSINDYFCLKPFSMINFC